jgi:hypothetical protein
VKTSKNYHIVFDVLIAAIFGASLSATASAQQSATAVFTTSASLIPGTDPAPTLTFLLNSNGTITGSMSANSASGLYEFGYSGPAYDAATAFSNPYFSTVGSGGFSTALAGSFTGGWAVPSTYTGGNTNVTSETWVFGSPGAFSSVQQLFSPNSKGFDVFAETYNGSVFTALAGTVTISSVPEPQGFALMLLGLGPVAAATFWRRRRQGAKGNF